MRQRERVVPLSGGGELRTPLLVPSVSSAGFRRRQLQDGTSQPEAAVWLSVLAPFLPKALLISAYDIHHDNLPDTQELRGEFRRSLYARGRALFVDSGVYEKEHGPPPHDGLRLDWDPEMFGAMVGALDPASEAIIVNYDAYVSYGEQIAAAQRLFAEHDHFSSDLLLKPEQRGQMLDVDALTRDVKALRGFDVIGVTEKELGDSLLDKLRTLSKLRARMTEAQVHAPIHVFGSLDPVLAPLFQAAGAEIFDGLSWLRFGYVWQASLYKEQVAVLEDEQDLTRSKDERDLTMLVNNARVLGVLNERMRQFANTGDWTLFDERAAGRLESAYRALTTRTGE
ncbi:MAG: hypothetical protein JW940_13695 [Polyangiaceae bacterium]|nr:hypothetical protein [Polyangiaceae bacterium]